MVPVNYQIQTIDTTRLEISVTGSRDIRLSTEFGGCGSNVVMTSREARQIAAALIERADSLDGIRSAGPSG